MLWLKTGVLYEFAGWAGALLGLNAVHPEEDPRVAALKKFASHCGTAFQLQDDILGIVGDESVLKKPVGSDIREGKQTVIVHEALLYATEEQKLIIRKTLGNKNATNGDIQRVIALFREHGIDRAKQRARGYIEKALPHLECLQPSKYKDLLYAWAEYMLDREF
jgi:geranylgeranyl diphosphate synthase type I